MGQSEDTTNDDINEVLGLSPRDGESQPSLSNKNILRD